MTNIVVLTVYATLAVITGIIIAVAIKWDKSRHVIRDFIRVCAAILGWQLTEILFIIVQKPAWMCYLFDLKLPFVAVAPVLLFLFVMRFFRVEKYVSFGLKAVLFVVPGVTTVLSLTSPLHTLIRKELTVLATSPLHAMHNERGVWFWVHTVYCYMMMLLTIGVILYHYRNLPKAYRMPSAMLLAGSLATIFSNILVIGIFSNIPFDFSLIGMTIALVFVYVGISMSKTANFLVLARSEIFNYLEDRVFILDNEGTVLDSNLAAKAWLDELHLSVRDKLPFDAVKSRMVDSGGNIFVRGAAGDDGNAFLMELGSQQVYQLREHSVNDNTGRQIGRFATFTDVTRYKRIIDELEVTAGIDPLTGLGNRRGFLNARKQLDRPENLPLSLLIGDINGLKTINDTLGHDKGDELLRVAARLLREACPENGQSYRIGGDEFVILLPNTDQEAAQKVLEDIGRRFSNEASLGYKPSIAVGVTTKQEMEQDFEELLKLADRNMYVTKMKDRRKGPPDRRVGQPDVREEESDERRKGPKDRRNIPDDRRQGIADRRTPEEPDLDEQQIDKK